MGYLPINAATDFENLTKNIVNFGKIIYLPQGSAITIDFTKYVCEEDHLFFIGNAEVYKIELSENITGASITYFNQDFYCIQIHDKEVSCDGILFNNIFNVARVKLVSPDKERIIATIAEVKAEFENEDMAAEEMLRILLKKIIITATRIYKNQYGLIEQQVENDDINFLRKFSQLVEFNYCQKHSVAEYADLLNITPKNLNKKISLASDKSPSQLIKDRLILEAKRLLAHTSLSAKEIAYKLGYDDEAYFSRFFTTYNQLSPIQFRKDFQNHIIREKSTT